MILSFELSRLDIMVWITAAVFVFGIVSMILVAWRKRVAVDEVSKSKLMQTEVIIYGGFGIVFLLMISGIVVQVFNAEGKFLLNLSATIIVAWVVMLICYYVWAIYFYNINLGWSDDKWTRMRSRQEDPSDPAPTPNRNPHSEETLGLPPGTVRGTIALTLLVGGLALTIGSFGMDSSVKANMVLVDNFDFYKEAFIMMIAFYFGVKSLDVFKDKGNAEGPKEEPEANKDPKEVKPEDLQGDFAQEGAQG